MKVYPQDLITLNEFKKYGSKIADCLLFLNEKAPEGNKMDKNDEEAVKKAASMDWPSDLAEKWGDKTLWEAETMEMPRELVNLKKLIKPAVKVLITTVHGAIKTIK